MWKRSTRIVRGVNDASNGRRCGGGAEEREGETARRKAEERDFARHATIIGPCGPSWRFRSEARRRSRASANGSAGWRPSGACGPFHAHQLHFTLKFFEELPETKRPAAESAAAKAAAGSAPFSLALAGLGTFPPRGPARVLWIGCRGGSAALVALASAVERELALAGFPPEARPFSAHLTLARVRDARGGRAAAELASESAEFDGGILGVREVVLFGSVLGPAGALHTPLARFPLAGS